MKKNSASYLHFISGALFGITAIINFFSLKNLLGFVYIGLAITFISLGFNYRKRGK